MKSWIVALLIAVASPALAQVTVSGGAAGGALPQVTVGALPVCDATTQGSARVVTDALNATTCTAAGGTDDNTCDCIDGVWTLRGTTATVGDGDKGDISISGGTWGIDTGVVVADDIATDGVGSAEVATDAVGSAEIAADAVGTSEIAADGVAASEIAAGGVGTSELADGTVAGGDLNEASVEGVLDLQDLQGAVTDAQVPDTITVNNAIGLDAAGARKVYSSARDCFVHDTDDDGTVDDREPCDDDPAGIRYARNFLGGGSDYGLAVNAAYADCIADGSDQCIVWLPRSESLSQSTTITACNITGNGSTVPLTVRGHGANRAGASGTLLVASASLRRTADTGAFGVTQDDATYGGRDTFTCAACNFRTMGLERGDLITTTDFTNAANNITASESPLVVWRAGTTVLVVESLLAEDAGLVTEGAGGNEDIQELSDQVLTCARNFRMEGVGLSGNGGNADFGVRFWSDNSVVDSCVGAGVPIAKCTGAGTGDGTHTNPTVIGTFFEDGFTSDHLWGGIIVTATNSMGQCDATTIRDAEVYGERYGIWVDNLQCQPSVLVQNTHINAYKKRAIYVSAGGIHFEHSGTITDAAGECASDTNGACWAYYSEAGNIDNSEFDHAIIEVTAGDGIHVHPGSSANSTKRFVISDTDVLANYDPDPTAIKLLEFDQGGLLRISGSRFNTTASGVSVAPTLTITSSFDGASPLSLFADPRLTGSGTAPTLSVNTITVQNRAYPLVTHATDCTARTDGTLGQLCYELDAAALSVLFVCEPTAGMCDTAGEWIGPVGTP